MHVDPHLAPRLMEVQIGFDCGALHLSSAVTRTDVQWDSAACARTSACATRYTLCWIFFFIRMCYNNISPVTSGFAFLKARLGQ